MEKIKSMWSSLTKQGKIGVSVLAVIAVLIIWNWIF